MIRKRIREPFSAFVCCAILWLIAPDAVMGGSNASQLYSAFKETFPAAVSSVPLETGTLFAKGPCLVEIRSRNDLLGYAVETKVVSRSGPFTIQVALSKDEKVLDVQIPKYPHRRGRAVRKKSFLNQFKGVEYTEPLRLAEKIDGVSGATSSGDAVIGGVRDALLMLHKHKSAQAEK